MLKWECLRKIPPPDYVNTWYADLPLIIRREYLHLHDALTRYTEIETFDVLEHMGRTDVIEWLNRKGIRVNKERCLEFRRLCYRNRLEEAKALYALGEVSIRDFELFRWTCHNHALETAKWLYSLGGMDIHILRDQIFRYAFKTGGSLKIAKWVYSLGGVDIHVDNDESYRSAVKCLNKYDRREPLEWLKSLEPEYGCPTSGEHP